MVETAGKVHQNPGGVRVYFKPAIGKAVWRKSGVNRQSAAVIRRNEAFASAMTGAGGCPATAGGVPWKDFIARVRSRGKRKNLGTGTKKAKENPKRFNKDPKAPKVRAAPTAA